MADRVKVTNISRHVSEEIIHQLFSFIGEVTKVVSTANSTTDTIHAGDTHECVVEFAQAESAVVAVALTGTELGDRSLVVTPADTHTVHPHPQQRPSIHALPLANPTVVSQMAATRRQPPALLPAHIAMHIPPSILHTDPAKAEEISRTVYVGNIASHVTDQMLMDFFTSTCGACAYVKMAGDGMQPTRFAFVEFADVESAQRGLAMNGQVLADRQLKVNHSKNSINKPVSITNPTPLSASSLLSTTATSAMNAMSLRAGAQTMAALQPTTHGVHQSGMAWPVLGGMNPDLAQKEELDRKIAALQHEMEAKYKDRVRSSRTERTDRTTTRESSSRRP